MTRVGTVFLAAAGAGLGWAAGGCTKSDPAASVGGAGPPPWFEDHTAASGINFHHESGHRGRHLFPEIMGGGAALLDMDGDGDLDAYLVQSGSLTADRGDRTANRFYRNDGTGRFEDVTAGSGAGDAGYGMGVATGDYDNDGDPDLYVTNVGPNVLLRNEGDGRFTDVTSEAGVGDPRWGTSTVFVDVDRDGDLDLFVVNYVYWSEAADLECFVGPGRPDYCDPNSYKAPVPDVLYRNNGDGTFTDVSAVAGLRTAFGNGLGVVCTDYDGDGFVDIFVANDGMPNQLWRNRGDGTFEDVAPVTGCAIDEHGTPKAGMGTAAADLDDDGDEDLLVVNKRAESDSLFRNTGRYFIDDTARSGLGSAGRTYTRFGMAFVDFDHDGYLDLYEVNGRVAIPSGLPRWGADPYAEPDLLLRGLPGGRFEAHPLAGGTSPPLIGTGRAAAFGDIDNDGGMDVLIVNRDGPAFVLRNTAARGNWIMLRAVNEHGADALGAVVTVQLGDRTMTRTVRTAFSYCAANDPRVHIGLGDAVSVDRVTVRWTDGTEEAFGPLHGGRVATLRRGAGTVSTPPGGAP